MASHKFAVGDRVSLLPERVLDEALLRPAGG